MPNQNQPTASNDTKTLVTVLLLIFLYPIGVIVMMLWTTWKLWVKILVASPIILAILAFVFLMVLAALNPSGNEGVQRAQCMNSCLKDKDNTTCIKLCSNAGTNSK